MTAFEQHVSDDEKRITEQLLTLALERDWVVSIKEEDQHERDWEILHEDDLEKILAGLAHEDSNVVFFDREYRGVLQPVGWVLLIWGNGIDLISDASANQPVDSLLIELDF